MKVTTKVTTYATLDDLLAALPEVIANMPPPVGAEDCYVCDAVTLTSEMHEITVHAYDVWRGEEVETLRVCGNPACLAEAQERQATACASFEARRTRSDASSVLGWG